MGIEIKRKNLVINKSTGSKIYTLMHMDMSLVDIDEERGITHIHKENSGFLPYALRKENLTFENIKEWASRRVLVLDRENAKLLLNSCNLPQNDKYRTARACRYLSVEDCFWLKEKEGEKWESFNLRKNHLSEALGSIALDGKTVSISGEIMTPELMSIGSFPKAWKREEDGLYLYKKSRGRFESEKEILVSGMLDLIGYSHVAYLPAGQEGVCRCKCMADETWSRLPFDEFEIYCANNGLDPYDIVLEKYPEDFMKMTIVDYITNNTDRHGGNWGFMVDNRTGQIDRLHPLYDHNLSFGPIVSDFYSYPGLETTVKELALQSQKELKTDLTPILEMDKEILSKYGVSYGMLQERVDILMDAAFSHEKEYLKDYGDFQR